MTLVMDILIALFSSDIMEFNQANTISITLKVHICITLLEGFT